MAHADNQGHMQLVKKLLEIGANDWTWTLTRALISSHLDIAALLVEIGAPMDPNIPMVMAEIQNGTSLRFLIDCGFPLAGTQSEQLALVALVLETYSRNPFGKHKCLEVFEHEGIPLPQTPPFAIHQGRIDLLERLIESEPNLLTRTYTHREICPPELGCHEDETLALCGTSLGGSTLLHLCVDYDEYEIAKWFLDRGFPVDTPAAVDANGYGGHTALFGCVVSQPFAVGLRKDAFFADLLLEYGASTTSRASLRKRLRFVVDDEWHEFPEVTPLQWGERFHDLSFVNSAVVDLLKTIHSRK